MESFDITYHWKILENFCENFDKYNIIISGLLIKFDYFADQKLLKYKYISKWNNQPWNK